MRRFGSQGYESTSLREIAEELSVTKAALYYHFKTKESILASIVEELVRSLDGLLAWSDDQPSDDGVRAELLRRFAALFGDNRMRQLMRLSQENSAALRSLPIGAELTGRIQGITTRLARDATALAEQMRAELAIAAVLMSSMTVRHVTASDEERGEAALALALEILGAHRDATADVAGM